MVLIIVAFLLVAGIAFFQAVHGFFSALIMAVLTILCAAFAFQYYEALAQLLYSRQPAHADAISLTALFVVPLLGLRLLVDRFIRGNALVGAWPDRIAGGAVGLVSGMVIVGIFTITIQLLPTGPRWLTYQPFNDALHREQSLAPFYPDEFTLGLVESLSGGSFKNDPVRKFSQVHDNLLLEAWCARNLIKQVREVDNEKVTERVGRMDAPPSSLGTLQVFEPNQLPWSSIDSNYLIPADPLMPEGEPSRTLIIRTEVDDQARDTGGKNGEKEVPDAWRLPGTQFRLACRKDKSADAPLVNHYPVAYLTAYESTRNWSGVITRGTVLDWKPITPPVESVGDRRLAMVGKLAVQREWKSDGPKKLVIDWVYKIGREEVPEYLAFRRAARQPIPAIKPGMPSPDKALDRITKTQ